MNDEILSDGICDACNGNILFPEILRNTEGTCPICSQKTRFESAEDVLTRKTRENLEREEEYRKKKEELDKRSTLEAFNKDRTPSQQHLNTPDVFALLIILISSCIFIYGLSIDTAPLGTHNIGLISQKINTIICGGVGILSALVLFTISSLSCIIHNQRVQILLMKDKS